MRVSGSFYEIRKTCFWHFLTTYLPLCKHFVYKNKPSSDHLPSPMCLHNLLKLPNEISIRKFHYKTGQKLIKTYIFIITTLLITTFTTLFGKLASECAYERCILYCPLKVCLFMFSCILHTWQIFSTQEKIL